MGFPSARSCYFHQREVKDLGISLRYYTNMYIVRFDLLSKEIVATPIYQISELREFFQFISMSNLNFSTNMPDMAYPNILSQ